MRNLDELRQKNIAELKSIVEQKRKELAKVKLDLKLKKIKNVRKGRFIRREIAQILTIIREKELIKEGGVQ